MTNPDAKPEEKSMLAALADSVRTIAHNVLNPKADSRDARRQLERDALPTVDTVHGWRAKLDAAKAEVQRMLDEPMTPRTKVALEAAQQKVATLTQVLINAESKNRERRYYGAPGTDLEADYKLAKDAVNSHVKALVRISNDLKDTIDTHLRLERAFESAKKNSALGGDSFARQQLDRELQDAEDNLERSQKTRDRLIAEWREEAAALTAAEQRRDELDNQLCDAIQTAHRGHNAKLPAILKRMLPEVIKLIDA